jgi:hypothetical protein
MYKFLYNPENNEYHLIEEFVQTHVTEGPKNERVLKFIKCFKIVSSLTKEELDAKIVLQKFIEDTHNRNLKQQQFKKEQEIYWAKWEEIKKNTASLEEAQEIFKQWKL